MTDQPAAHPAPPQDTLSEEERLSLAERVKWLGSHEASVVITDALTERSVYMLRPKVREVLSEASRALLSLDPEPGQVES